MPPNINLGKQTTLGLGLGNTLNTVVPPTRLLSYTTSGFNRFNPKDRFQGRKGRPSASGIGYKPRSMSDMTQVPIGGQMDLNDIIAILNTSVDGDPAINAIAELEDAYLWEWEPPGRVIPPTQYATMEWREQDAAETAGFKVFRAHKGICQSFNITSQGIAMAALQAQYQLGAREKLTALTTKAGGDPLEDEDLITAPVKLSMMRLFDSWDEMVAGVPQPTDSLQYSIGYTSGIKPLQRRDGVFDYMRAESDMRGMNYGLMLYNENGTNNLADLEDYHRDEDHQRFIKMRFMSEDAIESRKHWIVAHRSLTRIAARPAIGVAAITGDTLTPPTSWELSDPTGTDQLYLMDVYELANGSPAFGLPYDADEADPIGFQGTVGVPYYIDVGMAAYHTDQSIQQRGQTTDGDFTSLSLNLTLSLDEEEDREVYFALRTDKSQLSDYTSP